MAVPRLLKQIFKFACAGGVGVLLYFGILYILTDCLGFWYLLSAIIAGLVNFASNFILQKRWTFKNKNSEKVRKQIVSYFVLSASIFVGNLGALYALVDFAGFQYLLAQVFITPILGLISFIYTRRIFQN